mmetsp:Transcript_4240/g.6633  ORF Transcript_4240/g.6633 Transcript_4240/m.6633 type:complete len:95 (+) Transcript_4240:160-444(+)
MYMMLTLHSEHFTGHRDSVFNVISRGAVLLAEYLTSGVVNFSEEIRVLILVGISVLSQPKAQDEEMSGEKNKKKTDVINSEHLSGSVGGEGGRG